MLTARLRPLPEFVMIGAKRGGTTSFYYDLLEHRQICPLFPPPNRLPGKARASKGTDFFDQNYFRGERWYRSYFPTYVARRRQQRRAGGPVISGEASTYYMFHPGAPERAAATVPDTLILAVLRDPVLRTYSHWKERRREGREKLSFVDALAAEDDRIGPVEDRLRSDPTFYSYAHEQQSYARQSEYDRSLERWLAHYPRRQILVLRSEDYYRNPETTLRRATDFLGLEPQPIASGTIREKAGGESIDPAVADRLAARFAGNNQRLEELTGQSFDWR